MKLTVLAGYRQYLSPQPPDRAQFLRFLQSVDRRAALPLVRWTRPPPPDHCFLYRDDDLADQRVALFLDYVEDACAVDATVFILLPLESAVGAVDRASLSPDAHVCHFLDAAAARLGAEAVGCRRLCLSEHSQTVLRRLHDQQAGGVHRAGRPGPANRPVAPPLVVDADAHPDLFRDLQRNYGRAVLELAAQLVEVDSGRACEVADLIDRNRLLIRADVEPERMASALAPGGEIHALLTRSVVALDLGEHLVRLAERR